MKYLTPESLSCRSLDPEAETPSNASERVVLQAFRGSVPPPSAGRGSDVTLTKTHDSCGNQKGIACRSIDRSLVRLPDCLTVRSVD